VGSRTEERREGRVPSPRAGGEKLFAIRAGGQGSASRLATFGEDRHHSTTGEKSNWDGRKILTIGPWALPCPTDVTDRPTALRARLRLRQKRVPVQLRRRRPSQSASEDDLRPGRLRPIVIETDRRPSLADRLMTGEEATSGRPPRLHRRPGRSRSPGRTLGDLPLLPRRRRAAGNRGAQGAVISATVPGGGSVAPAGCA